MPVVDAEICEDLEEMTGADFMISPLSMPATTETLIQKHLDAGAIFVQRKTGRDLVSSLGARLNNSIGQMQTFNVRNCQCVLLFVGDLKCNRDGYAVVDGRKEKYLYWSVQAGLDKWTDRGGVVKWVVRDNLVPEWIERKEKHLAEFRGFRRKRVWKVRDMPGEVDETDPIQQVIPVSNKIGHPGYWRPLVVQIPGMGPTRTNALYQYIREKGYRDDPLLALALLTSREAKEIDGIGEGLLRKIRDWLGLEDVYELGVIAREEKVA